MDAMSEVITLFADIILRLVGGCFVLCEASRTACVSMEI